MASAKPGQAALERARTSMTQPLADAVPIVELAEPELNKRGRLCLALVAFGMATVLGLARWIEPIDATGSPRLQGTHEQLGLPPCTMVLLTGKPCPSCGMTTSFSHLMHGNFFYSLRANAVGTALAASLFILSPWLMLSALLGSRLGIRDYGEWSCRCVVLLVALLFVQWGVRMGGRYMLPRQVESTQQARGQ